MIGEAVDTVLTLGWGLAVWIVLLALAAGCALYAVVVTVWAAVRGAWRACAWLSARLTASEASQAPPEVQASPVAPQAPSRPVPSWAHTDKEAA